MAEGHVDMVGSIPHLQMHLNKTPEEAQTYLGLRTLKGRPLSGRKEPEGNSSPS